MSKYTTVPLFKPLAATKHEPWYVYELSRPDGRVFYVGKGIGDRVKEHEYEARRGCECHKCRVIRKIWKEGAQVQREIIYTTCDEFDAYRHEARQIARHGLKNLTNKVDCDPRINDWMYRQGFHRKPLSKAEQEKLRMHRASKWITEMKSTLIYARLSGAIERKEWCLRQIQACRDILLPPEQERLEGF